MGKGFFFKNVCSGTKSFKCLTNFETSRIVQSTYYDQHVRCLPDADSP